ncbi:MAG: SRPBCC family protein [Actinobacteria bacterium]|nr:MAG: SRPBCC family protein [Actinomycetota bacterium]
MPTYSAARDLLAPREDVWAFLAEPNHLSDWWPGISGVQPDRRGLAPGARWRIQGLGRATYVVGRKPDVAGTLIFLEVRPPEFAAWQFVQARLDVELRLAEAAENRTRAELTVSAPFLAGLRRSLPFKALTRLYALCQTGAES